MVICLLQQQQLPPDPLKGSSYALKADIKKWDY